MQFSSLFTLLILVTHSSYAFSDKHLERLKGKKDISYEDLSHENIGCPENSECSASNGKKLANWMSILKAYSKNSNVLATKLEMFRKENGLPINFLAHDTPQIKQSLDPVIFDSRCRHHNIKDQTKIINGLKFFRNNPKSDLVIFTKVKMGKDIYEIPYGDQPLMVWKKGLILIKDYEDFLYHLSVSKDGKWKVVSVPYNALKKGRVSRNNVECSEKAKPDQYFLGSYCSKIWNDDTQDYEVIEQQWACP